MLKRKNRTKPLPFSKHTFVSLRDTALKILLQNHLFVGLKAFYPNFFIK